jgi:hypothetical protein
MRIIVILCLCIIIEGCTNRTDKDKKDALFLLQPLDKAVLTDDFSCCIDTVIEIPLETKEESFIVDISKILLTTNKDFVILNSTNILMFDSTGLFKFKIGRPGKGPGEYIRIVDLCISENVEKLLVLDCFNNVLVYDLVDGSFIKTIKPNWKGKESTFDGICPSNDMGFFLFSSNPPVIDKFEPEFYCLGKFDSSGNLQSQAFPRKDFCFSPERFSRSFDKTTFMRPLEGENILYRIANGKISPILGLDFGKYAIPQKYIFEFPGNPFMNISKYIKSPYYKLPMGFFETLDHFYFWCGGPEGETHEFLFQKNKYNGIHWKGSDKFPFTFIASDSTSFYAIYNDPTDEDNTVNQKINPLKKYLKKSYGLKKYNSESNPSLIRISFSNIEH